MSVNRRALCALLPGMLLPAIAGADTGPQGEEVLPTKMYPFDQLVPHKSGTAEIRPILRGKLATGESVEVHETTLPPGGAPHPAHHHVHTEMWLVREGTVELTVNGTPHHLSAGALAFVRSNEEHGIKNQGSVPATYFVVAIGPGAGST
jgi:quercetin dioxygenase-like cupin family protein